jgi:hypothetical protein
MKDLTRGFLLAVLFWFCGCKQNDELPFGQRMDWIRDAEVKFEVGKEFKAIENLPKWVTFNKVESNDSSLYYYLIYASKIIDVIPPIGFRVTVNRNSNLIESVIRLE